MYFWIIIILTLLAVLLIRWIFSVVYRHKWLLSSVSYSKKRVFKRKGPVNIYLAICDHYQPFWGQVSQEIAEHRVMTWCREYPRIAREHTDFTGRHPIHTFFYSEEDYNPHFIDSIYKLNKNGLADVELLVAHQNDNPLNFKRKIEEFRDVLFHHHGLLRKNAQGQITYGFIHGYWALNNSRPDHKWCGVDNEIPVLKETGCYADFTYPSAPDLTQPSIVNSIYFSPDTPGKSKAHEQGYPAARNVWSESDLLFIQGPLGINWKQRHWGLIPSIENGAYSDVSRMHPSRVNYWVKNGIQIYGISDHVFIKLYTHGAIDHTIRYFFSENGLSGLWRYFESRYNDGERYRLHYMSAWEMYSVIRDLCTGTKVSPYIERAN